eukprot:CAMPEP_0115708862 /NCGR_PEP_ID=MMETSP0272-20121206/72149_1 /TAXON_ID=71861 /ORGANISM="Scrippsiella trochoidea, Strain CCMP3099" /LENGTH=251 /DNA_ID=CAMNT_0003150403 /DNA_START=14 /DNA_END=765 /DNA_ORIENTATION=+
MAAWIICLANFLSAITFTAFESLGVMYEQDEFFEGDPGAATLFWSKILCFVGVLGLVTNLFLYIPIVTAMGLKGSIAFGGVIASVGLFCISIPLNKWWYFGTGLFFVFGDNIMQTSCNTIITTVVDPSQFGYAIGMMTLAINIARAFGPFVFGPIYEHVSKTLPWSSNAVFKLIVVALCCSVKEKTQEAAEAAATGEAVKDDVPVQKERSIVKESSLATLKRALSNASSGGLLTPGASQEFGEASEFIFGL